MTISNYVIIDHAGSVGANKQLYNRAFAIAKSAGFGKKECFTMKTVCQKENLYYDSMSEEKQKKMKYAMRYNKNPKHVYIVCASQFTSTAQFIANIWETRNIPVSFVEEDTAKGIDINDFMTKARRCAMIWSKALGWQFSAKLFIDIAFEHIDEYTKRPDMEHETGSYGAKRFTNPQTFRQAFREVAPESECAQFLEHYTYLKMNGLLEEFLEPGYKLCPTCGRPIFETSNQCQWCDEEFEAVEIETFWEDSYNDDPDWNYEPAKASLSNFNVDVTHADLATKNYKTYLAKCKVRDSGKFYFTKENQDELA